MTIPSDRTWPLPKQPWVMRMRWSELLFAHWPVAPQQIAAQLPAGLSVDTFAGQAWIGVVPFLMSDTAPRGVPAVPLVSRFLELNVRTYVVCEGKPGVWFFSLDAESRIAVRVARAAFHLPYMDARMSMHQDDDHAITYRSIRTQRDAPEAQFSARYRSVGDPQPTIPGTLEHWLTARYCLYSADRRGRLYRGEIDHPPWQLSSAECQLEVNSMTQSLGIECEGEPHLRMAQPVAVRAWLIGRCGG